MKVIRKFYSYHHAMQGLTVARKIISSYSYSSAYVTNERGQWEVVAEFR